MNIADKARLYAGFARLLPSGGLLALQEPMAGPIQPPIYPQMWARDAATSFLRTPAGIARSSRRRVSRRTWNDVTFALPTPGTGASVPIHGIARIVMGDAIDAIMHSARRNRDEGRVVMVQAVFERL